MLEHVAPALTAFILIFTPLWAYLCWKFRWIQTALETLRPMRRTWVTHSLTAYGLFIAGLLIGRGVPVIQQSLEHTAKGGLSLTGIQSLQGVYEYAGGIFLWNTLIGLIATNFLPGLVAGVPLVVINLGRSLALGVALSTVSPLKLLAHLPTIVVELQGYLLLSAGAAFWVRSTFTRSELGQALRGGVNVPQLKLWGRSLFTVLLRLLPLSVTVLLIAGIYEAAELIYLIPHLP